MQKEEFITKLEENYAKYYKEIFDDKDLGGDEKRRLFWEYVWETINLEELKKEKEKIMDDFNNLMQKKEAGASYLTMPIISYYTLKAISKIRIKKSQVITSRNAHLPKTKRIPTNGEHPDMLIFVDVGSRMYGRLVKRMQNLTTEPRIELTDPSFYFVKLKQKRTEELKEIIQRVKKRIKKLKNILIVDDLIAMGTTVYGAMDFATDNPEYNIVFTTIKDLIPMVSKIRNVVDIHDARVQARILEKIENKDKRFVVKKISDQSRKIQVNRIETHFRVHELFVKNMKI